MEYYSVFGGSPFVLSALDYSKDLEWNIQNLLLERSGILRTHIEHVMLSEIQKNFDVRILEALGNGRKKYSEIIFMLGGRDSGLLDKQLKNLMSMDAIFKSFPINKQGDKKKTFYEIQDNLLRFYFCYIFGREGLIEKLGVTAYYKKYIESSTDTFINLRLEGIVCQYFSRLCRIRPEVDIIDIGSFWYDNPKEKMNGQFDCVVRTEAGYVIYEVKNFKRPMTKVECDDGAKQIEIIKPLGICGIGFVCTGGFDFESEEYSLIRTEELY